MSTLDNMLIVARSPHGESSKKKQVRQQLIHMAFNGDLSVREKASDLIGKIPTDACPCERCCFDRIVAQENKDRHDRRAAKAALVKKMRGF